jgi:hypothetical protein
MKSKTKHVSAMSEDSRQLSRRQFLRSSAVTPLTLITAVAYVKQPKTKIEHIDLFAVRYPTKGYFKFFIGPRGTYGRGAVIVKITADGGARKQSQLYCEIIWVRL